MPSGASANVASPVAHGTYVALSALGRRISTVEPAGHDAIDAGWPPTSHRTVSEPGFGRTRRLTSTVCGAPRARLSFCTHVPSRTIEPEYVPGGRLFGAVARMRTRISTDAPISNRPVVSAAGVPADNQFTPSAVCACIDQLSAQLLGVAFVSVND
jgi:hypothetical protein